MTKPKAKPRKPAPFLNSLVRYDATVVQYFVIRDKTTGFVVPDMGRNKTLWDCYPLGRFLPRLFSSPAKAQRALGQWLRGCLTQRNNVKSSSQVSGIEFVGGPLDIEKPQVPRMRENMEIVPLYMVLENNTPEPQES